jgi:hypothetical protein
VDAMIYPVTWSARAVRWIVSLHFVALLVQLTAMLTFLSGRPEGFFAHSGNAWLVLLLGALQLLAVLACSAARGDRFYTATAFVIVIAEALEVYLGRTGLRLAHVTLAMIIWAFALTLLIRTITAPWASMHK